MLLPNRSEIRNVISAINRKYTGKWSGYQIINPVIKISSDQITIQCSGKHHIANAYDLGLQLGGSGRFTSYDYGDNLKNSSIVTFKIPEKQEV